jgi:hypothetical protein
MSPEGHGGIGGTSAPWDDAPQNNNAFGGASNDIPPEYANDPEMWQAIQMSLMDSSPSNPQND